MPVSKTVDRGSNPRGPANEETAIRQFFHLRTHEGAAFEKSVARFEEVA